MKVLKMIRAMPNISVQSGEGITIYVPGRRITAPDLEKLRLILSSLGLAEQVPEMMMDSISALTASGPAYVSPISVLFYFHLPKTGSCSRYSR